VPAGPQKQPPAGAVLVTAAVVVVLGVRALETGAGPAPSAPPPAAVVVDAAQPVEAGRADSAAVDGPSGEASNGAVADKREKPLGEPEKPLGEKEGRVLFPARAAGHRIFVDDRHAKTQETPDGNGIAPLRLPCGPHVIKIGSGGEPQSIDLPCKGEVQLQ
jgi:hypothetical protein